MKNKNKIQTAGILIAVLVLLGLVISLAGPKPAAPATEAPIISDTNWPLSRAELIAKLVEVGAIDPEKIAPEELSDLNLLWAFGLANQNEILETGPMMDPRYGGAGNFASTGGWTLARGSAMEHYNHHRLLELTAEQQSLVESTSKNIYRPCCGNSTYFPDCNHGMAMLGLLQLLAAAGATESEMYDAALAANRLWFPDSPSSTGDCLV